MIVSILCWGCTHRIGQAPAAGAGTQASTRTLHFENGRPCARTASDTTDAPACLTKIGLCVSTEAANKKCKEMTSPYPPPITDSNYSGDYAAPLSQHGMLCSESRQCQLHPPVGYWDWHGPAQGIAIADEEYARRYKEIDARNIPRCQCSCESSYEKACVARERKKLMESTIP